MNVSNIEKVKELKSKVSVCDYGYHNMDEVDKYDKEVFKITSPLKSEVDRLVGTSEEVKKYLELKKELDQIHWIGRHFNIPK